MYFFILKVSTWIQLNDYFQKNYTGKDRQVFLLKNLQGMLNILSDAALSNPMDAMSVDVWYLNTNVADC